MPDSSSHRGIPDRFAYRSQTAFTIAAVAKWMTPFSGPSQRSWLSPASLRQKPPMSPNTSSTSCCSTSGVRALMAARHTSVPRPMVNVKPCPSSPSESSVRITT